MQGRVPERKELHRIRTSKIWRGSPLSTQQNTGKCICVRSYSRVEKEPLKRVLQNSIQAHTGPEIVLLSISQSKKPGIHRVFGRVLWRILLVQQWEKLMNALFPSSTRKQFRYFLKHYPGHLTTSQNKAQGYLQKCKNIQQPAR